MRRLGACGVLISILGSCARLPWVEAAPPNVLLVTIDTLRADHLGAYGYGRATSPFIDGLAAEGGLFETAYSTTATTAPSHASLFTGLYPDAHGTRSNATLLADSHVTLAERLRDRGYNTAAIVSQFLLNAKFGWAQGFEVFYDEMKGEPSVKDDRNVRYGRHEVGGHYDQRATAATDTALDWLAQRDLNRPFFLWVHYFDPHEPYDPPEPHRSLFATRDATREQNSIDRYDGEVHYTDAELRRLYAGALGTDRPARLLTVVTADHGEGLFEHGAKFHSIYVYEEQVRIPLIVHWPGQIPARRIPAAVSLVDVLPMLLELLEPTSPSRPANGASLARALRDGTRLDPARPIFMQRRRYASKRDNGIAVNGRKIAVRKGQYKLIDAPEEATLELYALDIDPDEANTVTASRPDVVKELQAELGKWQLATQAQHEIQPAPEIGEDDVRKLEALGYVR